MPDGDDCLLAFALFIAMSALAVALNAVTGLYPTDLDGFSALRDVYGPETAGQAGVPWGLIASAPYQQILAALAANPAGMRAKDVCLTVGVDPAPKHVEGARARLKRMVSRGILTENEPGIFALIPKRTSSSLPPSG